MTDELRALEKELIAAYNKSAVLEEVYEELAELVIEITRHGDSKTFERVVRMFAKHTKIVNDLEESK